MTQPTPVAGNQNTSTSAAGSILVTFFEAHNVGHVIEALHYCLGAGQTLEVVGVAHFIPDISGSTLGRHSLPELF